jgi:RHS repeat-associated protein
VGTLSYDARGNVLTAEGDSYTYSGDRVATFTPSGQSAVYFTHDSRGRMTYDGVGGVTIDYNYLNLPRKISGAGGTLAKYSYLANGSKTEAENGSGAGLVYRGSLIYKKASNGTLTFDGASIPEGRLLSGSTRLYVTDHLGSVKAVVNGNNGNLYEVNNYTVYGKQSANSSASNYISTAPSGEKFRQRFTGKEDQAPDFNTSYTDFGARQYSPNLRRWLVPDPLSEKYYGISPYAYCAGNPVNLVDKDGNFPHIVVGAITGAMISGGIALYQGKTGNDLWGAVIGGAVGGALAAATAGASVALGGGTLLSEALGGLVGGAAQSVTEQVISTGAVNPVEVAIDCGVGMVSGAVLGKANASIENGGNTVLGKIEAKYASPSVHSQIEKEVTKEFKAQGKSLGYSGKREVNKEVASRIKNFVEVESAITGAGEEVAKKGAETVVKFGEYEIEEWIRNQQ